MLSSFLHSYLRLDLQPHGVDKDQFRRDLEPGEGGTADGRVEAEELRGKVEAVQAGPNPRVRLLQHAGGEVEEGLGGGKLGDLFLGVGAEL